MKQKLESTFPIIHISTDKFKTIHKKKRQKGKEGNRGLSTEYLSSKPLVQSFIPHICSVCWLHSSPHRHDRNHLQIESDNHESPHPVFPNTMQMHSDYIDSYSSFWERRVIITTKLSRGTNFQHHHKFGFRKQNNL